MENSRKTSPFTILVFWAFVLIPLAWGILQTLEKAAALFK